MRSSDDEMDEDVELSSQGYSSSSKLAWLVVGIGIGAAAGILLAPQSGEDTREWISTTFEDGIDAAKIKAKRTRRQVGKWIDKGQKQVNDAIDAGREAFNKA